MKASRYMLPITVILGFTFLYAPIVSLVIYSFNASKLVTVWGGFSTKWYVHLFEDDQVIHAAWLSLKIAFTSATLALILGTIASLVLVRFGKFRFKSLLSGMISAPLVMPEVITGLSFAAVIRFNGNIIWLACGAWYRYHYYCSYDFLHGICRRRRPNLDYQIWTSR